MTSQAHTILIVLVVLTAFSLFLLWAGLKYIESCAQFLGIEQDDYYDEEAGGGGGNEQAVAPEVLILPAPAARAPMVVVHPPDSAGGVVAPDGRGGIMIV